MNKLLLIVASGLILTSCSGGGKDATNEAQSVNNSPTVSLNHQYEEKSINLVREDFKADVLKAKEIKVEGHTLNLSDLPVGFTEKQISADLNNKIYNQVYSAIWFLVPANVHTDSRGKSIDKNLSVDDLGIAGVVTDNNAIPKTGIITYTGGSFGVNSEGKLSFIADFNNKQVSGKIYDRKLVTTNSDLNDITLLPTTIGNDTKVHFMGAVESDIGAYYYGGQFIGPQADEVTGLILDKKNEPYEVFAGSKSAESNANTANSDLNENGLSHSVGVIKLFEPSSTSEPLGRLNQPDPFQAKKSDFIIPNKNSTNVDPSSVSIVNADK